jgi:nicotinate-nucleotide adenylyltransferase
LSTAVRFYRGAALRKGRLGIFPGAFNPVTRAHLAVAEAARGQHRLDQVVFLLPETFPHKTYQGASFDDRVEMLEQALAGDPALAIATSKGGLFIEIARAFRAACGGEVEIHLLCGRDAAERIAAWEYGDGPAFPQQLTEFQMLVASREGEYNVPPEYAGRIHSVKMPPAYSGHSSSAVREAIEAGQAWAHLVPDSVARFIRNKGLYGA